MQDERHSRSEERAIILDLVDEVLMELEQGANGPVNTINGPVSASVARQLVIVHRRNSANDRLVEDASVGQDRGHSSLGVAI